jgi:ABC-type dipeptide/oligopeptide/nickel transport system ATPase component
MMKDLKTRSIRYHLITHDLGIISDLCDEVCVMYAGRIVERGSIDDNFLPPRATIYQGLLRCLPLLDSDDRIRSSPSKGRRSIFSRAGGLLLRAALRKLHEDLPESQAARIYACAGHTSSCWLHALEEEQA